MNKSFIIALDGSAASGKSTLGCALAKKLNCLYLDTGVMYRAITWAALHHHIDPADEAAVSALAETVRIDILPPNENDGRQATILVDGTDITWEIRTPKIDAHVSLVSSYPGVRAVLTRQQRDIARRGSVVMVGRDIGTVVLPNADLKLFIEASVEVRARRRYEERIARGEPADYDAILTAMVRRDQLDREKPISPMVPADDAIIINTDNLSPEAVMARALILLEEALSEKKERA